MDEKDLLLEQLKMASGLQCHSDNMAWQGLSHLLTWNGILFSALGVILGSDSSGHAKVPLLSAIIAVLVALLGLAISIGWCHVQKRSQIHHRVRTAQAVRAEKRLTELVADESLSVRVYPDRPPLEVYAQEVEEVRSRLRWFGKLPNHTVVFRIALAIAVAWIAVLVGAVWLVVLSLLH